jgi:histidine triad (HIT) family protein
MRKDCIFCKIVSGKLPSYKVYEDNDFIGFLDIMPYAKGHTLVIPKKHYRWVWDVDNIGEYFTVCKKIAKKIQRVFNNEHVITLTLGEQIDHAHIHLLPGENYFLQKLAGIEREKLTKKELKETAKKLLLKTS